MAALTQIAKEQIGKQLLNLVTEASLKMVLVDSTYTFDPAEDFVDAGDAGDVTSHEISVSGYVPGFGGAGRRVPSTRVWSIDGNRLEMNHAAETWTALAAGATIGGVVYIVEKTSDTDSWVLGFDTLTADKATNGSNVVYTPNADGPFQLD